MKVKIADDVNNLFKSITLTAFIFISGAYLAYAISRSTGSFTIIMLIMFLGAITGFILTLKLNEEKIEYLVAFIFVLVSILGSILSLITKTGRGGINILSLPPDKYLLALNGITILMGMMGFISGCFLNIGIKKMKIGEWKYDGYLICKKCGGYYKLKSDESPDDFDKCQCGGELEYRENIEDLK